MNRKAIAGIVVALLAIAFYGAWPAWTAYSIKSALENRDAAALDNRIDFESVRASLRPVVTAKVTEGYDRYQQQAGATGALVMAQLRNEALPRIVEASLRTMVTPAMMIRLVHDARPLKEAIERILNEQIGKSGQEGGGNGGILGRVLRRDTNPPQPQAAGTPLAPPDEAPAPKPRKFSLANVKSFALTGPASFVIGVAKEGAATEAELTAEMRFVQGTWKLTGLLPRF